MQYQQLIGQANQAYQDIDREGRLISAQQHAQSIPYLAGSPFEQQYEQLLVNPQPIREASILAGFGPTKGRVGSRISSKKVTDTKRKALSQYQLERSRESVRRAQSQAAELASRRVSEEARREEIRRMMQMAEAEQRRRNEAIRAQNYANAPSELRAYYDAENARNEMNQRVQAAAAPISRHLSGGGGLSIY